MQTLVLDFETAYAKDYSLSKLTTEEYVNDERFQVIGFAAKLGSGATQWFSGDHEYIASKLQVYDWANIDLVCHNCFFDATILSLVFGITAAHYTDTLSMARAVGGSGNSLAVLVERFNLGAKGTEVYDAIGKRLEDFESYELDKYGRYCINDVELTFDLLMVLRPYFSLTEMELIHITIRMGVVPQLEVDTQMLDMHLCGEVARKAALLSGLNMSRADLVSNKKFATLLESYGVSPPMKVSPTTGKMTYAFAKTDKDFLALLDHPHILVALLVEIRLGIKSETEESRSERYLGIAKRVGALPVPLSYYGTATGRWAAGNGQKVNFQNIGRNSPIKDSIIAPKGHVIVSADLSSIELRVGMWVAGETEALETLAAGADLYKEFASKIFNVPCANITKEQRFVGKTSQLSLIFGVGAEKLRSSISTGGVELAESEAQRIVDLYRKTYPKVKDMWSKCKTAMEKIADNQGYGFSIFEVAGKKGIRFPSGLFMQYPELESFNNAEGRVEYRYKNGRKIDKLYGGKLFNNIVQGTARCVMAEAMVRVSKRYDIVLCIHDALYIIAPENEAEEALEFLIKEMTTVPTWIPGLPLDAEGGYGVRLSDAK